MLIQVDTRQKKNHHKKKDQWFAEHGIQTVSGKLLIGDYAIPSKMNVVVDTKANISELYTNLIQQHSRFHNECALAQEAGIKLYILIENKDGIQSIDEILRWKNPQMVRYFKAKKKAEKYGARPPRPPASNVQLIKIMHSMARDYGVEFIFVSEKEAGAKVVELLTQEM